MKVDKTEIINALLNDRQLMLKEKSDTLRGGTCPGCGNKTLWIGKKTLWTLRCDRETNCTYEEIVKERYPELFENWAKRFPASVENPNASAQAFMKMKRGLDTAEIRQMYSQGSHRLSTGQMAETVRFEIVPGMTWERLLEDSHIAVDGGKTRIKKQNPSATYTNKGWQPKGQTLEKGDTVYIVEGVFCALSMMQAGKKSIACFSNSNFPQNVVDDNLGKGINWVLAYDNDTAGHKYLSRYIKALEGKNESVSVVLSAPGYDWNDAWLDGKIDDKYLLQCEWEGREVTAKTRNKKAYVMYARNKRAKWVFQFDGLMYSANVNLAGLAKALDGDEFQYGFCLDEFNSNCAIIEIANCEIDLLHIEKDKFTEEQKFYFELMPKHNPQRKLVGLTASAINDPRAFSTSILNQSSAIFEGSAADLRYLRKKWINRKITFIETVPFIGYDEDTRAYIFTAHGYANNRHIKAHKNGYIEIDGRGIKTTLKSVKIEFNTDFNGAWIDDFIKVFDYNGLVALAFWTASLFTRQIKETLGSFPFLEVTGEKEAGKSTLIRFLWRLLGRGNYEGIDINTTSTVGLARYLSQVSNMPVVFLESDREDDAKTGGRPKSGVNWDELKKLTDLDGVLRSTGVKTNDSSTNEMVFRGAIVFTQNETITGSEALLSRIVHLHCTTAHKRPDNRAIADKLRLMSVTDSCGYLHAVITREKTYLNTFFNAFKKHRATLSELPDLTSGRCIDFHAQVMAAVDALTEVLPLLQHKHIANTHMHIINRARDRMQRLGADHPLVQKFWDSYEYINQQGSSKGYSKAGQLIVDEEQLNHSKNTNLIAVNLNEFYAACVRYDQERISLDELKRLLPTSTRNPFIRYKRVRSRMTDTSGWYWVFERGVSN